MSGLWFYPPVYVATKQVGLTRGVNNVRVAAEELLEWDKRGAKWRKAVQACIDAEEGRASADEVRKAFEAAAKDADLWRAP
nr:DUF982 domain-containing protein [Mesorhizobium sp. STM 4661]